MADQDTITIKLPQFHKRCLDWCARHGIFGATPEDVARFLLIRETNGIVTSGTYFKRAPWE